MSPPLRFRFVMSGDDHRRLPPTRAEVAFLGRSNVGKSSLLNGLANQKRLAHVSKTPGRTQLLNLFELGDGTSAVDLPGYGFAKVPGAAREHWQEMIEGYLLDREGLVMRLVLVDGAIGPTPLDIQMLEWLQAHDLPHAVVASKLDKVKSSRRPARAREVAETCGVAPSDVIWTSASTGAGIEELRSRIVGWLHEGASTASPDELRSTTVSNTKSKGRRPAVVVVEPDEHGVYADEDEWN